MPPKAVRMPWEKSMPSMSSGVVSLRTRMTFSLFLPCSAAASSAVNRSRQRQRREKRADPWQ